MILCKLWLLGLFLCQVVNSKPHDYDYYYDSLYDDNSVHDIKIPDASPQLHEEDYGYNYNGYNYYDNVVYDTAMHGVSTSDHSAYYEGIKDGSINVGSDNIRESSDTSSINVGSDSIRESSDTSSVPRTDYGSDNIRKSSDTSSLPRTGYNPETSNAFLQCLSEENDTLEFLQPNNNPPKGVAAPPLGVAQHGYLLPFPNNKITPDLGISPIFTRTKYFQGDIIFRNREEYCKSRLPPLVGDSPPHDDTIPTSKWPNAMIPIRITTAFSQDERKVIENAMDEICKNTCIKFLPYEQFVHKEYLSIQTTIEKVCATHVGFEKGDYNIMKLSDRCFGNGSMQDFGTVLHELMHASGFYHTHSRVDRDPYINIHEENIEHEAKDRIINTTKTVVKNELGLPYDIDSVMHYPSDAFLNEKARSDNLYTITKTVKEKYVIFQKHTLSESDVKAINAYYNCPPIMNCASLSCPTNGRCEDRSCGREAACMCNYGYRMEGNQCIETCLATKCSGNRNCREGFEANKATCVCNRGYRSQGEYCLATCSVLNCTQNGRCEEGTGMKRATCVCNNGYRSEGNYCIATCSALSCPPNRRCEEGSGRKGAMCICKDGYRLDGNRCRVTCSALSCPGNRRCEEGNGSIGATCVCNNGYRLDGNQCIATCSAFSCSHNGRCEEGSGSKDATCVCNNGYRLDGKQCRVTCSVLNCKHDEFCVEGYGNKDANCVCNPAIAGSYGGGYLPPRKC